MKKGMIRESSDYCPNCGHHSIMAYSTQGRPIHYVKKNQNATTDTIMDKINKESIGDLVCGNCGKHFLCDYSLGFPRAIEKFGLYMSFFEGYLNHNK